MVATIFDFNGVLVDDEHVHLDAFREVLRPKGITITDETYAQEYLGFDDVGAFRAMLEASKQPVTEDDVRSLVGAKKHAYFSRIEHSLRIFPGAVDLVRRRAARGPVGIVSGALEAEIRYCLERMGVIDIVSFIVPAEHTTSCKPDPEGYLLGLAALRRISPDVSRDAVVVVEDSLAGIQAAKAAGLRCVGVAHSYAASDLVRAGADVVTADLLDLTDLLLDGASGE